MTYDEWIEDYKMKNAVIRERCSSATLEMNQSFPELRRVAGFATTLLGHVTEHFWLETKDGEVIDPTASQFPGGIVVEYREFISGDEVRVGKCMDCGDSIYARPVSLDAPVLRRSFCDEECEKRFVEWQG